MSIRFLMGLAVGLALAASATAQNTGSIAIEKGDPPADKTKASLAGELLVKSDDVGGKPLFEVLQSLSKRHGVTFVIMEEQFKAKKLENIKDKKSPVEKIETKGLTVEKFLTVWLPTIGATHLIRPDYVEIVPLRAIARNEPKPETLETLLDKLHGEEVVIEGNLNEIPLFELLQRLSKRYELTFVINEESFRSEAVQDVKSKTPNVALTQIRGMTLHQLLTTVLDSIGATYMIKGTTIEIVPPAYAAKMAKTKVTESEDGRKKLAEPLVSAVIKEKPLNEAVAAIAERYDLTVIVAPQAGDSRTGFVNARLLNIPADKALELLAVQGDLRVVRKGAAYLITSREHADGMFNEKMEKERAKIELEKFRASPPPKPEAPSPQPKAELVPLPGGAGTFKLELVPPKPEPKP